MYILRKGYYIENKLFFLKKKKHIQKSSVGTTDFGLMGIHDSLGNHRGTFRFYSVR